MTTLLEPKPMVEKLPEDVRCFARDCLKKEHPRSWLIPVLHRLQNQVGYLKEEHLDEVGVLFNISTMEVKSVATFYHYFTLKPKGVHEVSVCLGTACHVKGAENIYQRIKELLNIEEGETTPEGQFSITPARCVGMCALAPVLQVGKKVYGNVTLNQVEDILKENGYKGGDK